MGSWVFPYVGMLVPRHCCMARNYGDYDAFSSGMAWDCCKCNFLHWVLLWDDEQANVI